MENFELNFFNKVLLLSIKNYLMYKESENASFSF